MKRAGDLCKIDNLGRIVIPARLRKKYDFKQNDTLELFMDNDCLVMKKYIPTCIFCGKDEEIVEFQNKFVCKTCVNELEQIKSKIN
ncbi:MAG: AbrB/MazE/SpoVT family DNA-binding domain-containing protein [Lachnospiraceae bacterium]|nr:AbrB/MazE/SpoVT family DNA-binding domain-containing protein [Lachnospiraceae bacterium]